MPNNLKSLNEIHGSWYDKSNPVVKMSGTLKKENFEMFEQWVELNDFVIAVGSSMVGMSTDGIVERAIGKKMFDKKSLGCCIINIQLTRFHETSSLNIFGDISEVMLMLAKELDI